MCPECGQSLKPGAAFCGHCGAATGLATGVTAAPGLGEVPTPATPLPARATNGRRRKVLVGGLIAALALAVVAAAVGLVFGRSYLSFLRPGGQQAAARMLPAETPLFTSVNPNLRQAAAFLRLRQAFTDVPQVDDDVDSFVQELEDETGLNWERDVQPWLGAEVVFAFMDEASAGDEGWLLLAATRDRAASDQALQRLSRQLEDSSGVPATETMYRDIPVFVREVPYWSDEVGAFATVNDYVVLADSEARLQQVIDVARGSDDSLDAQASFRAAMSALPASRIASFYANLESVLQAQSAAVRPSVSTDFLRAMAGSASFEDDGVRIDWVVTYDKNDMPPAMRQYLKEATDCERVLKALPEGTFGFLAGGSVKNWWDQIVGLQEDPRDFEESLRDIRDETGLDVHEDIFGWMTGEWSMALVPARPLYSLDIGPGTPPIGFLGLIGVQDEDMVDRKMRKLARFIEMEEGVSFYPTRIRNQPMQILELPDALDVSAGYGFIGDHLAIGSSVDVLEGAFDAPSAPITDNEIFKKVIANLPGDLTALLFVNVEALLEVFGDRDTIEALDLYDFQRDVAPWLWPVKGLGIGAAKPTETSQSAALFVYIASSD